MGMVMCPGHTSVQPSVAKGEKASRGDSGWGHEAWPPERLGCLEPPSQASTKPQLSCDLASCILFSLQSRLFILLPVTGHYYTQNPCGLTAFSKNSGRATEGAQLLRTICRPPAPFRAASAENPRNSECASGLWFWLCDLGPLSLPLWASISPSVQRECWLRCPGRDFNSLRFRSTFLCGFSPLRPPSSLYWALPQFWSNL